MSDGYEPRRLRGHAQCSPFATAPPTLLSTPREMQTRSVGLDVLCNLQLHTDDNPALRYLLSGRRAHPCANADPTTSAGVEADVYSDLMDLNVKKSFSISLCSPLRSQAGEDAAPTTRHQQRLLKTFVDVNIIVGIVSGVPAKKITPPVAVGRDAGAPENVERAKNATEDEEWEGKHDLLWSKPTIQATNVRLSSKFNSLTALLYC
ncbi:hypothetical protein GALMADRAFT_148348 [Galerina marginata CBS 339.88]|uniref:Uncharacterized protein n=1 Tax=Galerina marginata (strain CBS 339.88) TaxID=685588 RepID=A0A067S4T1_GALM3|nr:hypothetical protein GALMADRAFT_148348 [Galerina marginata CBS 339.88]